MTETVARPVRAEVSRVGQGSREADVQSQSSSRLIPARRQQIGVAPERADQGRPLARLLNGSGETVGVTDKSGSQAPALWQSLFLLQCEDICSEVSSL